jgi:hypothetical protein
LEIIYDGIKTKNGESKQMGIVARVDMVYRQREESWKNSIPFHSDRAGNMPAGCSESDYGAIKYSTVCVASIAVGVMTYIIKK